MAEAQQIKATARKELGRGAARAVRREGSSRGSLHDITNLLSQPEAEPLVATIVLFISRVPPS